MTTLAIRRMSLHSYRRDPNRELDLSQIGVYDLDTEELLGHLDDPNPGYANTVEPDGSLRGTGNPVEGGKVRYAGQWYRISTRLEAGGGSEWRILTPISA